MSDARVMRAFRYLVNDCKRSVSLRDVEGALERADRYEAKPDYRKRAAGAYVIKGDSTRPPRQPGSEPDRENE